MDAELKTKWVKALRSGEYKQANGTLLSPTGAYCCLGVLAKIQDCDIEDRFPNADDRVTITLPPGFNAGIPKADREDLANRNDGAVEHRNNAHSFPEIADYIEANL